MNDKLYTLFALKSGENEFRRLVVDKLLEECQKAAEELGWEWYRTVITVDRDEWPSKYHTKEQLNAFRRRLEGYARQNENLLAAISDHESEESAG